MRLIIAGSRTIKDQLSENWLALLSALAKHGFDPSNVTEVVSGTAVGPDRLGERWARVFSVPLKLMPADWSQGTKAGPIRNAKMGDYADAALILWDGESKGTKHMIDVMKHLGKPYYLELVDTSTPTVPMGVEKFMNS